MGLTFKGGVTAPAGSKFATSPFDKAARCVYLLMVHSLHHMLTRHHLPMAFLLSTNDIQARLALG